MRRTDTPAKVRVEAKSAEDRSTGVRNPNSLARRNVALRPVGLRIESEVHHVLPHRESGSDLGMEQPLGGEPGRPPAAEDRPLRGPPTELAPSQHPQPPGLLRGEPPGFRLRMAPRLDPVFTVRPIHEPPLHGTGFTRAPAGPLQTRS